MNVKCYDTAHQKDFYREPQYGLSLTKTTSFKQLKNSAPKALEKKRRTRFCHYNNLKQKAQVSLEQLCSQVNSFDPVEPIILTEKNNETAKNFKSVAYTKKQHTNTKSASPTSSSSSSSSGETSLVWREHKTQDIFFNQELNDLEEPQAKNISALWNSLSQGLETSKISPYQKTKQHRQKVLEQSTQALTYINNIALSLQQDSNLKDIFSLLQDLSTICQHMLTEQSPNYTLVYTLEILEKALNRQSDLSNYFLNFLGTDLNNLEHSYNLTCEQLTALFADLTHKCAQANNSQQRKEIFLCFIKYLECFKKPELNFHAPALFVHSSNHLANSPLHHKLTTIAKQSIDLALTNKHNLALELMQPNNSLNLYLREQTYLTDNPNIKSSSHANTHSLLSSLLSKKGLNKTEIGYYLNLQRILQIDPDSTAKYQCPLNSSTSSIRVDAISLLAKSDISIFSLHHILSNDFSKLLLEQMIELYFQILNDKQLIYHECYKLPLVANDAHERALKVCSLINEHCYKNKLCFTRLEIHDDYIELHAYFKKSHDYLGYQRINNLLQGQMSTTTDANTSPSLSWDEFLASQEQDLNLIKMHVTRKGGSLVQKANYKDHLVRNPKISKLTSFVNFATQSLMCGDNLNSSQLRYNNQNRDQYHSTKSMDVNFASRHLQYQGSINFFLALGVQDAIEHLANDKHPESEHYNALSNPKVPNLSMLLYVLDALERQEAFLYSCNCGATTLVLNPCLMAKPITPSCKQCGQLLNFIPPEQL